MNMLIFLVIFSNLYVVVYLCAPASPENIKRPRNNRFYEDSTKNDKNYTDVKSTITTNDNGSNDTIYAKEINFEDKVAHNTNNKNNPTSGKHHQKNKTKNTEIKKPISDLSTNKPTLSSDEVVVKRYIFYVIGSIMILLIVVIILISLYCIHKGKKLIQESEMWMFRSSLANIKNSGNHMHQIQLNQELSLLSMNSLQESSNNRQTANNENNLIVKYKPHQKYSNSNVYESPDGIKIYKSLKQPLNHQVLLREQMKKICEDALRKTKETGLSASLKDLNILLQKMDCEKYSCQPRKSLSEKSLPHPRLHKTVSSVGILDVAPVYELPATKNIIIEDQYTKYLFPVSRRDFVGPTYVNAHII